MKLDSPSLAGPNVKHRGVGALVAALVFCIIVAGGTAGAAPFVVDYSQDGATTGFNDPNLGSARRNAFEAALSNWALRLSGTVPIKVEATFTSQGGSPNSATLGQGAPLQIRDFGGAPQSGVFYPVALVNQIVGTDVNPSGPAIVIQFNSDVDNQTVLGATDFYYGTDGNGPSNDIDFYSVALHELGHGLGFVDGFSQSADGSFFGGFPSVYATLLANGPNSNSTRLTTLSQSQRAAALIGGSVFMVGANARAANGGNGPKMYSPNPYEPGSSVGHLDESTFSPAPDGAASSILNELMTPVASQTTHEPGPLVAGILADMGWTVLPNDLEIVIAPSAVSEAGGGSAATGTVTRSNGLASALTVTLASSNTGKAVAPPTVTIPIHASSATFPVAAVDNAAVDGTFNVIFTATASGFTAGTASLNVTDDDTAAGPDVAGFTPTSGPVTTSVTVTGTNFTGATAVKFNGTAATFTVTSDSSISTAVPFGATTGPISVTTPVGTDSSGSNFTVFPPPGISSFTPTQGPVGQPVTITGSNFNGATSVRFNGTPATFTLVSGTTITTNVPAGATPGQLSVTTPGGTVTSSGSFLITANGPPTISGFTPPSGPIGTLVTVTGTNFTAATSVFVSGVSAAFIVNSATTITVTVPGISSSGSIVVTTPLGTATSSSNFVLAAAVPPGISSFTPTSGTGGTAVVITGTNLLNASGVAFNGLATTFTVVSATTINTVAPTGVTTGPLTVVTPGGTATSATSFTAAAGPNITGFTPASGPAGTLVTVSGTGFTGATDVEFNGTAATFTVVSATSITASVPAGATSGVITVTTPVGADNSATSFTVVAAPTVSGFTPTSGATGAAVTITGTNFTGATVVKFNTTNAVFTVVSATSITATVPAGATSGVISVTTPGGTASSAASFTILQAAGITSFTPTSGPVGTAVTITGSNFTGATQVRFNTTNAVFTLVSATSITTTVPAGATTGKISVITPAGTSQSAGNFTVTTPPTITSFTPASAKAGANVFITGTNFTGATAVKINNVNAPGFTVNVAGTQITVPVPANATSGKISVTTPSGTATSTNNFTMLLPPAIFTFSPISGIVGTTVTVTGKGFTGASIVLFNNKATTGITIISDTQLSAVVPVGTVTGPITVTTTAGSSPATGKFQVLAPPNISTFSPASGKAGATITILGSNFTGLREFKFFNNKQPSIVSVTDTQIVAKVPVGATTGPMFIRTGIGSMTTKGSFFVIPGAPPRGNSSGLSTATLDTAVGMVALRFNTALDAAALTTDSFALQVNGATTTVESAGWNATTNTVTLGLPEGAVKSGDKLQIAWSELHTTGSQSLAGSTTLTAP